MINANYVYDLYKYFSYVFHYGLKNKYSYGAIEENICKSELVKELENNIKHPRIYELNTKDYIKSIYNIDVEDDELNDMDSISFWLGEAYIRLFYHFNKSFEYIFSYLPIEEMIGVYPVYHEMDFSQLFEFFELKTKKKSILSVLLKKRGYSKGELSVLTGISVNTIKYYCKDEKNMYDASFENVTDISHVLSVDPNIFKRKIHNYTYSGQYNFDKSNIKLRSSLGMLVVSYFSQEIRERQYRYDSKKDIFISDDDFVKIIWTELMDFNDDDQNHNFEISKLVDKYASSVSKEKIRKTNLVIFEYNQISSDASFYSDLNDYGFKNIFIVNNEYCLLISKNSKTYQISDSVLKIMIERAKRSVGVDIAFY